MVQFADAAAVDASWVEYPQAKSAVRFHCDQLVPAEGSDTESRQPLKTDLTFFLAFLLNFREGRKSFFWEHSLVPDGNERQRSTPSGDSRQVGFHVKF